METKKDKSKNEIVKMILIAGSHVKLPLPRYVTNSHECGTSAVLAAARKGDVQERDDFHAADLSDHHDPMNRELRKYP